MGVREILCSSRLETKAGKNIPGSSRLEFLEHLLTNNSVLSDAEDNTSGLLNRRDIANLPLFRTLLVIRRELREPSFWEIFCSISISKFGIFKNPLTTITSLSELYLWRFILLVQTKKVISISYGSSTSSWKPWTLVRLHLIFKMKDIYVCMYVYIYIYIYISIPTRTQTQNSVAAPEAPNWKISSHDTSLKWSRKRPYQHENSYKLCDEKGHPLFSWNKVNENRDKNMVRISQRKKSHCRTNTWVRSKK